MILFFIVHTGLLEDFCCLTITFKGYRIEYRHWNIGWIPITFLLLVLRCLHSPFDCQKENLIFNIGPYRVILLQHKLLHIQRVFEKMIFITDLSRVSVKFPNELELSDLFIWKVLNAVSAAHFRDWKMLVRKLNNVRSNVSAIKRTEVKTSTSELVSLAALKICFPDAELSV